MDACILFHFANAVFEIVGVIHGHIFDTIKCAQLSFTINYAVVHRRQESIHSLELQWGSFTRITMGVYSTSSGLEQEMT